MFAIATRLALTAASEDTLDLEVCYQRHRQMVYRVCMRYAGGHPGWAEDLMHDVFVKLIEHAPRLRDQQDLGGWLYRVAANVAISRLRRERGLGERLRALWSPDEVLAPASDTLIEHKDAAQAAMTALGALPGQERVAICMKLLDGKSQVEIAEILGLSEGYVSKLIARAWQRLHASGWRGEDHDGQA
jgi:RNA polymerase sigma factor (sigma-70 family)